MIIVCTASADTYITDKIISGQFRATDANVGRAGTLDLFRLYNETALTGVTNQNEISRILIKFDLQPLYDLTGTILNINSSNFKAYLQLFDIASGNATPANFNVIAFPLSQSFDEGVGRDVSVFNDLDRANFITASYANGTNTVWFASGANSGGLLNSNNIDFITSGNLGSGVVNLFVNQNFVKGTEDLSMDITTIVSATMAGKIPDKGIRLSFSGTEETDAKTRFVKRFASRHAANSLIRPRLLVRFNDRIQDDSADFNFDSSGSVFLETFQNNSPANIVSGSSLTAVTGANCLLFNLVTGSFSFTVTGSQHTAGTGGGAVTGLYSASFAIASINSTTVFGSETLAKFIAASGSVKFDAYWKSLDGTFGYHTGSLTLRRPVRAQSNFTTRRPLLRVTNANVYYHQNDTVRFRVFGVDLEQQFNTPVKRPIKLTSIIYDKVYYQVIDRVSKKVILDYDDKNDSTRLSIDGQGMFFDFKMQALPAERSYGFRFYIIERGNTYISSEDDTFFEVRS
jgi:hypothetical protein